MIKKPLPKLRLVPGDTSYELDRIDAELSTAELSGAEPAAGPSSAVIDDLRSVLAHDPHSARAWFTLGVAQADADMLDDARSSWLTADDLAGWAAGPARNLARLADRQGDQAEARRRFAQVLATEGSDAEASAWLQAHPG